MSIFPNKPLADHLSFTKDMMWVHLKDARVLGIPFEYFPRLLHASKEQLKQYKISGGGIGLHWDAINEDISVEGLIFGRCDQTVNFVQPKKLVGRANVGKVVKARIKEKKIVTIKHH